MGFRRAKGIFVTLFLIFSTNKLFAVEEYVSKIYKDIDRIFVEKSEKGLNTILESNKSDKNYYLIEKYAEKKVRRLIVDSDYEFAMAAVLVIIDNNLDNEGAVDMYQTIAEAYDIQMEYEAKKEQERLLELARIELEKEKKRASVNREYVGTKNAEGEGVYVNAKETNLKTYSFDIDFGLVNYAYTKESSKAFENSILGVAALTNYHYDFGNLLVGFDLYGAFNFLTFNAENPDITMLLEFDIAPKIAFKKFSKYFFLRTGYSFMKVGKAPKVTKIENVTNSLISPIIGLELNRINVGPMKVTLNGDYLLSTLWMPDCSIGAQGMVDISIPFSELEKVKMNFHIAVKDKVLVKNTGVENRIAVTLAIGAENVNK